MIVTIVADVLGEENNGTSVACMNLYRYLTSVGDTVRIVCCDADKKGKENYYVVDTLNLGCFLNYIVKKNHVTLAKVDKNVLRRAITGADVVHLMIPFALAKGAIKVANELHVPITAGFHCQAENFSSHILSMNNCLVNHLTYKIFYNKVYKYVSAIHYPTQFIEDVFEKEIKHKTNGYVISNGVRDSFKCLDVSKPYEIEDKYVILFTGRFSREKSHKVLVKAVAKSKYKDHIQLIFAGEGPYLECVKKLAKKKKLNDPIINFFSHEELVKIINYADLYCHPAEIELEGIACIEAVKCGLVPVIANSKRCATKYFALDKNNLFKCNDANDLASKIDFWIENPELKEIYKQKYLQSNMAISQTECMQMMRNMFTEVIDNYERA